MADSLYFWLKARSGDTLTPEQRWYVVAAALVGSTVGSKLVYLLSEPALLAQNLTNPFFLMAGKSIVGGLIGALLAVELVKKWIGVTQSTGDVFAVPLAIGIAVGRAGCFLTGLADHTHGLPANLPWAVDYGDGIPRHPAQLYEIAFLLLFAVVLLRYQRRPHRQGDVFKLFMVGYFGFRLLLEFLKPGVPILGLNVIQWACLVMLLYYARLLLRPVLFARRAPA